MKKIVSVILSIIMLVSCLSASCITAFAYVASVETTKKDFQADVTVNGLPSIEAEYEISDNPNYKATVEFTYSGNETLKEWEIKGLKEGVDYIIISQDGNKLVIGIINDDIDYVVANAITENAEETTQGTTKANNDKHSPDTGAGLSAVALMSIAGGLVILAKSRKAEN